MVISISLSDSAILLPGLCAEGKVENILILQLCRSPAVFNDSHVLGTLWLAGDCHYTLQDRHITAAVY